VIVRLLAVLMVIGLVAGSVDARALDTPATALTMSIEEADEVAEVELVVPIVTPLDETRAFGALITSDSPPRYDHCSFVFRPPRAYAFN
jgi:hypothetical protein